MSTVDTATSPSSLTRSIERTHRPELREHMPHSGLSFPPWLHVKPRPTRRCRRALGMQNLSNAYRGKPPVLESCATEAFETRQRNARFLYTPPESRITTEVLSLREEGGWEPGKGSGRNRFAGRNALRSNLIQAPVSGQALARTCGSAFTQDSVGQKALGTRSSFLPLALEIEGRDTGGNGKHQVQHRTEKSERRARYRGTVQFRHVHYAYAEFEDSGRVRSRQRGVSSHLCFSVLPARLQKPTNALPPPLPAAVAARQRPGRPGGRKARRVTRAAWCSEALALLVRASNLFATASDGTVQGFDGDALRPAHARTQGLHHGRVRARKQWRLTPA